jgi:hypothetical protein
MSRKKNPPTALVHRPRETSTAMNDGEEDAWID